VYRFFKKRPIVHGGYRGNQPYPLFLWEKIRVKENLLKFLLQDKAAKSENNTVMIYIL